MTDDGDDRAEKLARAVLERQLGHPVRDDLWEPRGRDSQRILLMRDALAAIDADPEPPAARWPQFLYSQRALIVRMCEAVGIDRPHVAGVSDEEWAAAAEAALARAASLAAEAAAAEIIPTTNS